MVQKVIHRVAAPATRVIRQPTPKLQYVRDYYIYTAKIGNMAASAVVNTSLPISADADFEWIKSTAFATLNGGTAPFTNAQVTECAVLLTDSGSGRQLMSAAVPVSSIFGTGELPFINPLPRLFKANSNINLQVTNLSTSNSYNNIFLNFCGYKMFSYQG